MPAQLPSDLLIRSFQEADRDAVIDLWRVCDLLRPWNDPGLDIDRKMTEQAELFLVGIEQGQLCASAMAGFDGHRGWINYLAVASRCRGRGYGRQMVTALEQALLDRGGPKPLSLLTSCRCGPPLRPYYPRPRTSPRHTSSYTATIQL